MPELRFSECNKSQGCEPELVDLIETLLMSMWASDKYGRDV